MLELDRRIEIDRRANALRQEVHDKRIEIWPDGHVPRGLEVADPELAAWVLGIDFQWRDSLALPLPGANARTAGLLDRRRGLILVSRAFGPQVARFTAAHELGHWLYHDLDRTLHRDLPIKGLEDQDPDPIEREANYFAACFLMPRKYVRDQFRLRFPSDGPFVITDATVHHLRTYAPDSVLHPQTGSLTREKIFARAGSYAGRPFVPLSELFKVSVETMAIRIKELGLIRS